MRKIRILAVTLAAMLVLAAMLALAGCGSSGSGTSASAKQTLVLWENYGPASEAAATRHLVAAFEKTNPNIKIKVVSQPASNYFALLQTAAISRSGPDLAVMWTGQFTLKYAHLLVNLKGHVPSEDLARLQGLQWSSPNFNEQNGTFVVPLETQFYIAFYNKKAFRSAGITALPATWSDLYSDCGKLRKAGYTPMVYGNSDGGLGAEFYPWYDMTYMMIGAYPLSSWKGLYDGSIPWTSSTVTAQLDSWHKLMTSGCTNPNVITNANNDAQFAKGKAAMFVDGNWDTQQFSEALGSNLGALVPPFSNAPVHSIAQYPGDGYSVMSYSQHKEAAYKFLTFLTTPQAAAIENANEVIPDIKGATPSNATNAEMVAYVTKQHYSVYPFLDNIMQTEVVNAGSKVIPTVLSGSSSPQSAMSTMQQALQALPAEHRSGSTYK